jgi:BirA family transcriptional regulator, biotin operon repressor / biotin---[acetyl-CoA-carboxylase] ligase
LTFDLQLYKQVWQRLNQSKIITPALNNLKPIPLYIFDRLTSTNTKTWELIDRQIEIPIAIIALQQTAGKGQWGHTWVSSPGGLYLSVALDLDLDLPQHTHLVMATAWGIVTVLRYYQLPVTIKWSNDLMLEGHKLGGIKIETRNLQYKINQAVVGVGINWCNPVPDLGINLKSYYEHQTTIAIDSLEELTAIASYGIILGYQYYLSVGIERLLARYTTILSSIGKQVTVNDCLGEIVGVTTDGQLKVQLRSPGASTKITLAPGQISLGY